ncbi:hypothetical protein EWM64_g5176 [Hericium alpestre]|uniref:Major facilitator superfamily (MFS) profile domain-containing protein n=1 Tax=Hericium alpestre TaxID=135208 RepID=A0A4Y9ZXD6_9AGAM|nr:hypothetical protein EWM64_g5176 [Hericium alpestre]
MPFSQKSTDASEKAKGSGVDVASGSDEKHPHVPVLDKNTVDAAAVFVATAGAGVDGTIDPQAAARLRADYDPDFRRKIDWHLMPLMCNLMNGVAIIFLGFLGFGVLHIRTGGFMPWQWLTTITGLLTLIVTILFWFFFPDSVTTAWFLTPEERVAAVQRIRVNQAGVENKVWKREQFIETLTDPKTWVFAVFAAVTNLLNSLTNQRQLIVNQFGFNVINTTLIGCVDGLVEIAAIFIAVTVASVWPNGRIYAAVLCFVPALIGTILVSTLAFHIKGGLLVSYWLSIFGFPPFTIFLSWVGMVTAGHTKRTTTNAIVLAAYGLGNAVGPFMWKAKYSPRNHVPWGIFSGVCVASALLLLLARWMLAQENKRRDHEAQLKSSEKGDACDVVYIMGLDADGRKVETQVDRAFLDLTDIQNREYRYPL